MFNHSVLIYSHRYFIKIMMKSDPIITYNHMEEDEANNKIRHFKKSIPAKLIYLAEFAIIGGLLLLMFYIF